MYRAVDVGYAKTLLCVFENNGGNGIRFTFATSTHTHTHAHARTHTINQPFALGFTRCTSFDPNDGATANFGQCATIQNILSTAPIFPFKFIILPCHKRTHARTLIKRARAHTHQNTMDSEPATPERGTPGPTPSPSPAAGSRAATPSTPQVVAQVILKKRFLTLVKQLTQGKRRGACSFLVQRCVSSLTISNHSSSFGFVFLFFCFWFLVLPLKTSRLNVLVL